MKNYPYRFAQLRVWAVLGLLLMVFALLGGMIWRNFDRLETMRAYVTYAHRIQQVASDIQASLTDYVISQNRELQGQRLTRLTTEIVGLASNDHHVAAETPLKLRKLREIILDFTDTRATLEQQEAHLLLALNVTSSIIAPPPPVFASRASTIFPAPSAKSWMGSARSLPCSARWPTG